MVTIPNGIEWAGVDGPGLDLRRAAGVGPEVPVVGFVGRLCPGKGVETLLHAAALMPSHRLTDHTHEGMRTLFNINYFGTVYMNRAVLPAMSLRGGLATLSHRSSEGR